MDRDRHGRLAILGTIQNPAPSLAGGGQRAAYRSFVGLERSRRFSEIDIYLDYPGGPTPPPLPEASHARVRGYDKSSLPDAGGRYWAIQVANGDTIGYAPHLLRPREDWVPVICDIGATHHEGQWYALLTAALTGALRDTDAFFIKAERTLALFQTTWDKWADRFGPLPRPRFDVLPNGVDGVENAHDASLRSLVRRQLALGPDDVAFLSFNRISPGTKGDLSALVQTWRHVIARAPRATLVIAGYCPDAFLWFAEGLRSLAREHRVGDRVVVIVNPYQTWPRAREALMSAADVLCHVSTGLEESSTQTVLEGMAHGLPVLAVSWAGVAEMIRDGREGWIVDTLAAEMPDAVRFGAMARSNWFILRDAGRSIACDGRQFVDKAVLATNDRASRLACGAAARKTIETRFLLEHIAARRVALIDEVSDEAFRRGVSARPKVRPLVEIDDVAGSLASGRLDASTRVRWVASDAKAPETSGAAQRVGAFENFLRAHGPAWTLGEAAAAVDPPIDVATDEWRRLLGTVARWISVNAVEIVREPPPPD